MTTNKRNRSDLDSSTDSVVSYDKLLNYKQAAQFLSISVSYLRKLKNEGKIASVLLGSRGVRFRVRALVSFIEGSEI